MIVQLPEEVLCERCGETALVVTQQVDERALRGQLAPSDHRRQDGFFFTIDCPNCGIRDQSLAPPP